MEYIYKARDHYDDIDTVCFNYEALIKKLEMNKLCKEDRKILIDALYIIIELRSNPR